MSRVYLCLGQNAAHPYYFDKMRVHIYSVEELCYFLKENAFLMDNSLMDGKLTEWIETECGLPELSQKLKFAVKGGKLQDYVETLFIYTGYYSREEILETGRLLISNEKISIEERKKAQADYFLEGGRYVLALQEYENLLVEVADKDPVLTGRIYHKLGSCQARLFLFEKAARSFKEAFRLTGEEECRLRYLAAMRLQLSEREYILFLEEHPEHYEASMELEKRVLARGEEWKSSENGGFIAGLAELSGKEREEKIDRKLGELMEEYRATVVQ